MASRDRTRLNSSVHKLSLGLKLKPSTGILNLLSNPQRICFFRAFHRLFDSFTIRAFTDTEGTWLRLKYGYDKPCLWSYSWRDLGQPGLFKFKPELVPSLAAVCWKSKRLKNRVSWFPLFCKKIKNEDFEKIEISDKLQRCRKIGNWCYRKGKFQNKLNDSYYLELILCFKILSREKIDIWILL